MQRPVSMALFWALLTWSVQPALNAGVFFELLWLDLFPAGTFIPPNAPLALTIALGLLACLPDPDMRTVLLVLAVSIPTAYAGSWTEQWLRTVQNRSYTAILTWNRRRVVHASTPDRLVLNALMLQGAVLFGLYVGCSSALLIGLRQILPLLPSGRQPTWPMIWMCAALGAVLALRVRKAYALGGVAVLLLSILSMF